MNFKKLLDKLPDAGLISKRMINSIKKAYKNQSVNKKDLAKYAIKSTIQGTTNVFPGSTSLVTTLVPQIDIRPKLKVDKFVDEVLLRNYKAYLLKKARKMRDEGSISKSKYNDFINSDKMPTQEDITNSIKNSGNTYSKDKFRNTDYQKINDYLIPIDKKGSGLNELNKLSK